MRTYLNFIKLDGELPRNWVERQREERLSACSARTDANFFVNRGTHHRQYLIGNVNHAMHGRNVIRDVGHNLLFGVAARLELASGNQIIAIKDFRHQEYPQEHEGLSGWVLTKH